MNAPDPLRRLASGLRTLGFEAATPLAARLLEFSTSLLEANRHTNLVGAKSLEDLVAPHLLDSLAPLAGLRMSEPIVDVGSGGGLPGIAAAFAWPRLRFVLFEPRAKRAAFLKKAVETFALTNVTIAQTTAETAGRGEWRERAGTALARALAAPGVAFELTLPLLRRRGRLVLYQGKASAPTVKETAVLELLGGTFVEARRIEVPYLEAQRHAWIIEKRATTPPHLPRRSGMPRKEPLSARFT